MKRGMWYIICYSNKLIYFLPLMASVEVSKLSQQEVAELACTYAALILHDDDQKVTSTYHFIKATNSTNSSLELELKSNHTGLKYSQRLLKAKTSVHFSTSEDQLLDPPKLLLKLQRKHLKKRRKRRKLLPHPQKKKNRTWIWVTSSDDCLLPNNILPNIKSSLYQYQFFF